MNNLSLIRTFRSKKRYGKVFSGDALSFLKSIGSDTASIIFIDPPFNLGKDYGDGKGADKIPHSQYINWLESIIIESKRVLKFGGAIYIYHLPKVATEITGLLNSLFQFRHWIAISMKNNFVRGKWLYPAHYALLYYTKGAPSTFNRPKIPPSRCRKCNEYIKDYGGYKKIIEEKGLNLSDIWDDISPLRHASTKSRIANELPLTIFNRIVEISGKESDVFVEPFSGSGNGVITAIKHGMRFLCCDLQLSNCELIVDKIQNQT